MKRLRDPNWLLIFIFLGFIAVPPLIQTARELTGGDGLVALELFGQRPTAQNLRAFEDKLEETAMAARAVRPWFQFATFASLKEGGDKVVAGSDGWYFFKPGLKYIHFVCI